MSALAVRFDASIPFLLFTRVVPFCVHTSLATSDALYLDSPPGLFTPINLGVVYVWFPSALRPTRLTLLACTPKLH